MTPKPNRSPRRLAWFSAPLAVAVVLGLCGCNVIPAPQEDLTRYYLLSTPSVPAESSAKGLTIGVKSVSVASYLNKRELVVRVADNEVSFKDGDRWAEPIESGVAHVVRSRLLASAGIRHVYLAPLPIDAARDFDVTIEITRCEGARLDSGSYVARFAAVIEVRKPGSPEEPGVRHVFQAPDRPWDGKNYGQLAGLLSADVEAMADSLAASVAHAS